MSGSKKKIVKREVRFVTHIPKTEENEDFHYIKEQVTFEDGTQAPSVRMIRDYMRPVYVTKQNCRTYREKKEFEDIDNLLRKDCTESDVIKTTAMMLDEPWMAKFPRMIGDSPYVFAGDIDSCNLIKLESLTNNNFIQSPYKVMAFDLEATVDDTTLLVGSNVIEKTNQKGHYKIFCTVSKDWIKNIPDIEKAVLVACDKLIPEYNGKLEIEFELCDSEVDMVTSLFKVANQWAPDFMSIWNMDYDIGQAILPLLKRKNLSPIDVLCDQRVPRNLRKFKYTQGKTKKVTASGKESPIHPADQWHKCDATMSFRIIDSMCTYRALRVHKGRETSYALDNILYKELGKTKLRVPEADHLSAKAWHVFMQKHMIAEYIVYNFIDNIRLLELDAKTNDLSSSVPSFAEIVDFNDFNSSDRKNYCSLFVYGLSKDRIIGTSANIDVIYRKMADDPKVENNEVFKYNTLGTKNWIQTLPQGSFIRNGLTVMHDFPFLVTNIRGNTKDIDSVSSYPSCTMMGNVSKETCQDEVISIDGLYEATFRAENLGIVVGNTNALEYGEIMFSLPSPDEIVRLAKSGQL